MDRAAFFQSTTLSKPVRLLMKARIKALFRLIDILAETLLRSDAKTFLREHLLQNRFRSLQTKLHCFPESPEDLAFANYFPRKFCAKNEWKVKSSEGEGNAWTRKETELQEHAAKIRAVFERLPRTTDMGVTEIAIASYVEAVIGYLVENENICVLLTECWLR